MLPPTYTISDPITSGTVLLSHVGQITVFPSSTLSSSLSGGEVAYDGPFSWTRSPIYVTDKIQVPVQELSPNQVMELNVEVFPTNAVIKEGHRLRVAIGPSDFPHSMSPVPQALNQLGGLATIYNNKIYPSSIVMPVLLNP